MRCTSLGNRQAASTESAGSKPTTSMPKSRPKRATKLPIAPKPTTPSVLPASSAPANRFFSRSISAFISPAPMSGSCDCANAMPPTISREASSMAAATSSFTALALAPGVLKTGIPRSLQTSSGMLFTPAPARAIAVTDSGISLSCSL